MRYNDEGLIGKLDNWLCQPRKNSLSGLPRIMKWGAVSAALGYFCCGEVDGVYNPLAIPLSIAAVLSCTVEEHTIAYHVLKNTEKMLDKLPVHVRAKRIKKAQDEKMKKAFECASQNLFNDGLETIKENAKKNPNSCRANTLEANNANVAPILEAGKSVPLGGKIVLGKGGR